MTPQLYELQKSSLPSRKEKVEISHSSAYINKTIRILLNSFHILWFKSFFEISKPSSGVFSNCFSLSWNLARFQFRGMVREAATVYASFRGFFTIHFVQYFMILERWWEWMGCFCLKDDAHHQSQWSADVEVDDDLLVLVGKWADPGGTAMPGQPATRPEQAPEPHPLAKISLISKGAHGPRIRY